MSLKIFLLNFINLVIADTVQSFTGFWFYSIIFKSLSQGALTNIYEKDTKKDKYNWEDTLNLEVCQISYKILWHLSSW